VRLLVAKRKMAGTEPKGDTQKTINTTSPPRRAVPLARLTCRLRLLRRNFVQDASKTIALIGGVIQLCRKIITRVTSKINPAAGFCVELRRLSTKKVTNVISGEL
jgi:hypothetical protein